MSKLARGMRDLHKMMINGDNPYLVHRKSKIRSLAQREADLVFLANLYLKGFTYQQMQDALNKEREGIYSLTLSSIKADISVIHQRWIASYLVDFDQAKSKELAHIDMLEQEYWEAWKRSQQKTEEIESEKIEDKQGSENVKSPHYSRSRVKKLEKNRDGNDDFLKGIQWCIEQRCKILGLNLNVTTQNINVNWRKEAEAHGVDPDGALNDLVQQFVSAASVGRESGGGSMGESGEDTSG